jgi:glucose uptake protein
MFAPDNYAMALVLMLASMVFWGSWPNFLKKLAGWRLEYFYIDFSIGFLLTAVLLGQTLGSGGGEPDHFARLLDAGAREIAFAAVGGFIWNIGNLLLLNSIMIAGLAVAFPIAAIPAIVLGIGASYWLQPVGNPIVLGASAVILLVAAQTTAAAYRRLGDVAAPNKGLGIATALISGLLIGFFPPFVTAAITGDSPLDAYTVSTFFTAGAFVATFVAIPILLRRPLIGADGRLGGYLQGRMSWHVMGILAGALWCSGTVFNFISAGLVGIAISVGVGSGAPMIGALWGVFVWREFATGSARAKALIAAALVLYVIGVAAMSIAYTLR